jgi:hypothetical protein
MLNVRDHSNSKESLVKLVQLQVNLQLRVTNFTKDSFELCKQWIFLSHVIIQ